MAKSVLGSQTFEDTQSQSNFIDTPAGNGGGGYNGGGGNGKTGGGGGGGRKGAAGKQEGGQAAGAVGAGGNVTQVQKVDMTKEQKRAFIAEIKVEMREMINQIAVHHVAESTAKTTKRTEILEATNQDEHAEMFSKFEKEMLVVAEYCKKQV